MYSWCSCSVFNYIDLWGRFLTLQMRYILTVEIYRVDAFTGNQDIVQSENYNSLEEVRDTIILAVLTCYLGPFFWDP